MPHSLEIKANQVLADSSNYPEVVVAAAMDILACFSKKRQTVQAIWTRRDMWRRWLQVKQASNAKSLMLRNREASTQLKKEGFREADLNILYAARVFLGTCPVIPIVAAEFEASCQMVACTDIMLVHRYLSCVNARRYDPTVAPVGFIRQCSPSVALEILAWKLLRDATQALQSQEPITNQRIEELQAEGLFGCNPFEIVRKIEEEHDIFLLREKKA